MNRAAFLAELAALKESLLRPGSDFGLRASDLALCPLCIKFGVKHPPVVKAGRHSGLFYLTSGGLGCPHATEPAHSKMEKHRHTVVNRWNEWCRTGVSPVSNSPAPERPERLKADIPKQMETGETPCPTDDFALASELDGDRRDACPTQA